MPDAVGYDVCHLPRRTPTSCRYAQHSGMASSKGPLLPDLLPAGRFAACDHDGDGALDEAELQGLLFPSDSETSGDLIPFIMQTTEGLIDEQGRRTHHAFDEVDGVVQCSFLEEMLAVEVLQSRDDEL